MNEQNEEENILGCTWVDTLSEEDLSKLRPLLFVELSAIFDKAAYPFPKIKPHKRKRKQGKNFYNMTPPTSVNMGWNFKKIEKLYVAPKKIRKFYKIFFVIINNYLINFVKILNSGKI